MLIKNSRNFSCAHHFFCSHQGWTLYLARSNVNIKISRSKDGTVSWLVRGLQCARSRDWSAVTSRPCFEFNFSPFCVALTSFKYPLKGALMERGGWKWAHHRPQIYQLLLSRVIDVKYGCFTIFCTTWVPASPNNEIVSNLQRGGLLNEFSFGLFGFQFDKWKTTIFIEELRL